jgi:hypothetical protein
LEIGTHKENTRLQAMGHQVCGVGVEGARKRERKQGVKDPTLALLLVTIKFAS